ncbi:uncharacterized protein LOC134801645 [Cydia splendana]|uniref:uncharacterized protein LOC134801645 n=1 Tax=Cydia splendana TaxID=1100963 RepID=UPI00300C63F4
MGKKFKLNIFKPFQIKEALVEQETKNLKLKLKLEPYQPAVDVLYQKVPKRQRLSSNSSDMTRLSSKNTGNNKEKVLCLFTPEKQYCVKQIKEFYDSALGSGDNMD